MSKGGEKCYYKLNTGVQMNILNEVFINISCRNLEIIHQILQIRAAKRLILANVQRLFVQVRLFICKMSGYFRQIIF